MENLQQFDPLGNGLIDGCPRMFDLRNICLTAGPQEPSGHWCESCLHSVINEPADRTSVFSEYVLGNQLV